MSNEITAPLVRLDASDKRKQDITRSKGPSGIIDGFGRVKEYVKIEGYTNECARAFQPRTARFDQPYQVAAERLHSDWNTCNRVFLGEIADCNLKCPYCYQGDRAQIETADVTPSQYLSAFMSSGSRVLRISGGEPMLHVQWVEETVSRSLDMLENPYVWIDTNLTVFHQFPLWLVSSGIVGFCGCFKPGIDGVSVSDQIDVVASWVKSGVDLYIYWPTVEGDGTSSCGQMVECLEALYLIDPALPLRVTPIHIDWAYAAIHTYDSALLGGASTVYDQCRTALNLWSNRRYVPEILWLPSHQVPLRMSREWWRKQWLQ